MNRSSLALIMLVLALLACDASSLLPGGTAAPPPTEKLPPTETLPPPPTATLVPTASPTPVLPTATPAPTFALPTAVNRTPGAATASTPISSTVTRYDPTWGSLKPTAFDLTYDSKINTLSLNLKQPVQWLNEAQGALVYKTITGDFMITALVKARKRTADQPPSNKTHFGGLAARNPSGTTENYVYIAVGYGTTALGIEAKSTTNNVAKTESTAATNADVELRLCRAEENFSLYRRAANTATWVVAGTYNRPDLPEALQVGATIFSGATPATPDLKVTYENLRIEPIKDKADCQK